MNHVKALEIQERDVSVMREKDIEEYVARELPGGKLLKWVCPGQTGVPDRILILPFGRVIFIEFKQPTGRVSLRQQYWLTKLRGMGHEVLLLKSLEEAKKLVASLPAALRKGGDPSMYMTEVGHEVSTTQVPDENDRDDTDR